MNELLKYYKILLYWSAEDGAYLAEMPELPGCMADGATPEAAITNLYEVAALWVRTAIELGRPVPVPSRAAHLLEVVAQGHHTNRTPATGKPKGQGDSKRIKSQSRKRQLPTAQVG
ncbi:MAG: hypothetical protein KatS3mg020_0824 [Fimbriimonadales bacterium]|nr:MAG: hypothetical protein KatS3mg019_0381 [Fimbriimonadales bacterium]GIV11333.1 MAG: hypothetical protein KatS3mg020_0824 [Fimbriimonadales bacterium]